MARCDRNLPPVWLPQIPSCNSSSSSSDALRWIHSKYSLEYERLYNLWSSDNQNRRAFLHIFSASDFSLGRILSLRNFTMGSIQLGPTLTSWIRTMPFATSLALSRCLTKTIQESPPTEEVASVANESVWVFPLLEMCDKLNRSKFGCKRLTWLKYSCILTSLASNFPFTWPTISLEFENISTVFPPIFYTMAIPYNKVSYSASLFVAENPSLRNFSMIVFSRDTRTSPTLDPLWFATPSTNTFQGSWRRDYTNRFSIHVMLFCYYFYWWFSKFGHQVS